MDLRFPSVSVSAKNEFSTSAPSQKFFHLGSSNVRGKFCHYLNTKFAFFFDGALGFYWSRLQRDSCRPCQGIAINGIVINVLGAALGQKSTTKRSEPYDLFSYSIYNEIAYSVIGLMTFVERFLAFNIQLSDPDRGLHVTTRVKLPKHEQEPLIYFHARLFAFLHSYEPGLQFYPRFLDDKEPALFKKDVVGTYSQWIDVECPSRVDRHPR